MDYADRRDVARVRRLEQRDEHHREYGMAVSNSMQQYQWQDVHTWRHCERVVTVVQKGAHVLNLSLELVRGLDSTLCSCGSAEDVSSPGLGTSSPSGSPHASSLHPPALMQTQVCWSQTRSGSSVEIGGPIELVKGIRAIFDPYASLPHARSGSRSGRSTRSPRCACSWFGGMLDDHLGLMRARRGLCGDSCTLACLITCVHSGLLRDVLEERELRHRVGDLR